MSERELAGGCLCGAIKYTVHGPFLRFLHCHCARCRKVTGSAHATNLFVVRRRRPAPFSRRPDQPLMRAPRDTAMQRRSACP